jgi:hypothetical protein
MMDAAAGIIAEAEGCFCPGNSRFPHIGSPSRVGVRAAKKSVAGQVVQALYCRWRRAGMQGKWQRGMERAR